MKHTPTPWIVSQEETGLYIRAEHMVENMDNKQIAKMFGWDSREVDAEFIVRAVNRDEHFEELLEAAKEWLDHLKSHISKSEPGYENIVSLEKAIEKAEGKL